MKHEKMPLSVAVQASRPAGEETQAGPLAADVMNIMEQGILVWSPDGVCEYFNTRIFDVLDLKGGDIEVGMTRATFRARAMSLGEMSPENNRYSEQQIAVQRPYAFDRVLPSGRVVLTHGRPTRGGGYVVTFTDVTEARKAARDLVQAKVDAEAAEARAHAVLAQERARQHEEKLLSQLDEWLQSCKSLGELFTIVATFMAKLLPDSKGELYIYSNSRDVLDGMCNWNTVDLHDTIAPDSCWALRRGRSYEFDSEGLCFVCDHVAAHQHTVPVNEYICVPIIAHGDTVGLLHVRFVAGHESAARIGNSSQFAIRCGEHISMAIANVKLRDELHDQSIRDPLTGLYNRRYFMDAIRREIAIAARRDASFGLISFDADKFKTFNDNHGHDAGDMVLRAISETVRDVMSKGEVACRMGGEEFAVLVPGASQDETMALAEKLREAVSLTQVRYGDGTLPRVTISAGVASFPRHGSHPQQLLKRADEALYLAKDGGRDRVEGAKAP
ncbi:MAG: diguanylate cyclase [Rhodobacterales bacterium]|nr:diguanylate cyclase [Rhodobacterales bacterium]